MKKRILLALTMVLILLLASCNAESKESARSNTTSVPPQDQPPVQVLTFYEAERLNEFEKIQEVIADYIGADSFALTELYIGQTCNCDGDRSAPLTLVIFGKACIGENKSDWGTMILVPLELRNHIYDSKMIDTEQEVFCYRFAPGMAEFVRSYLQYGVYGWCGHG